MSKVKHYYCLFVPSQEKEEKAFESEKEGPGGTNLGNKFRARSKRPRNFNRINREK